VVKTKKNNDDFTLYFDDEGKRRGHNRFVAVFLAILLFIAVFIPMFGSTLRYQTSYLFQEIFNALGSLAKLAGMILVVYGFLSVFLSKRIKIDALIFGVILLWIGSFLTFTPFTFFGISIGDSLPPIGYH
jgi:hypothetical protein